tara:strand:- start:1886 stop:2341 length:456 start_codon:yes stop_codon:yes gene_type:complete
MTSRQSRESEAHDNQARRKPWRPVRRLETPPPPDGYVYRWIRESMLGQEDRSNVSRRVREGWELVKGSDLPEEWQLPTMDGGRHSGVVYNEGLVLAKIPEETVNERNAHYERVNQSAKEALDNTMFSDSAKDSRYVKYDPQRSTQVTFGKA